VVLAIFVVYKTAIIFGLLDIIDPKNTKLTFGLAFLVGIVASVSSCLAVVGSVVIAFSEKYKNDSSSFWNSAVKPNLAFHLGRVATFFVLGGMLGLLGGEINISGNAISIYTILIALVMGWLGLNILGIIPSISNVGVRIPRKLTNKWEKIKKTNHRSAPLILGGLSFFLPCGFTQSMQIFALASGSFLVGALTMALFSLGTVPVLLLVGVTTSWTRDKNWGIFKKVAGIMVLTFAIYTLNSGLAIQGIMGNIFSSQKESETTSSDEKKIQNNSQSGNTNEQMIEMHVTTRGFEPSTIKIKKNVPVRWVIKGDSITGCTNKIIIPSLNIEKSLKSGDNIVTFTPDKSGEIPFSCWMGMVRGKFLVE
jgi:sulfite exporter TauE/SafE